MRLGSLMVPALGLMVFSCWLLMTIVDNHMRCSQALLKQTCEAFSSGTTTGNLCTDLCEKQTINIKNCLTTAPEEKVFSAEWKGREVILKFASNWFEEFQEFLTKYKSAKPEAEFYRSEISNVVHSLFGKCTHCDKLTTDLLELADVDKDGAITVSEMATTVALLNQQEPAMLMVLNGTNHSLDFFGYCGGVYVVEKVSHVTMIAEPWKFLKFSILPEEFQPLQDFFREKILEPIMVMPLVTKINDYFNYFWHCIIETFLEQSRNRSDHEAFHLAHSFLDLVAELSANQYGSIQSCDIHVGNFGFGNTTSFLKLMDLDHVFPQVYLKQRLSSIKCSSHENCKVGGLEQCTSLCEYTSGLCTSKLEFQDLQNLCWFIFPHIFTRYLCCKRNKELSHKGVLEVISFCTNLPVTDSLGKFRSNIEAVRTKLRKLERDLQ